MSCGYSVEWLHRKIDGELTSEESIQVDDHLATCTECREHLSELDSVGTLLRQASVLDRPAPEVSPPLLRPRRSSTQGVSRRRVFRASLPTAALLLFAASVFILNLPEPASVERDHPMASSPRFEVVRTGKDILAVNIPSKNPDVHIVWFYPLDPQKGRSQ